MKGKFTGMELTKYTEGDGLYFSKLVHRSDKLLVLAIFTYRKSAMYFDNFPYLFEGFSYDFFGEFEVTSQKEDVINDIPRRITYFKIKQLDDIKINS